MAYKKTNWQDTLRDAQGNVIQKGTPLNAQALGKIEDGIVQAEQKIDTEISQVAQQLAETKTELENKKADVSFVNQQVQVSQLSFKDSYATLNDLQTAFPNGDSNKYAVLADNMIYSWIEGTWKNTQIQANGTGIAEGAVTPTKTTFVERLPKGLVSENINHMFTTVGAINYLTGQVSTTATTSLVSDYIDLTNAAFIFRYINDGLSDTTNTAHAICFYDENYNVVGGHGNINSATNSVHNGLHGYKYEIPVSAKYARMNATKVVMDGSTNVNYHILLVKQGFVNRLKDDYNLEVIENLQSEVNNLYVTVDKITDENFDQAFKTEGALNYTTGVINTTYTTSLVSDFIDLSNVSYIFRYINDGLSDVINTAHTIAFYDGNKQYLSGQPNISSYKNTIYDDKYGYKYEIPTGAMYARINTTKAVMDGSTSVLYHFLKVKKTKVTENVTRQHAEIINKLSSSIDALKKPYNDIKIAIFGDSLIEFGNIPELIAHYSGATVYDCSVGGTRMGKHNTNSQGVLYNEMCMFRLANYINTGDYSGLSQAVTDLKTLTNDDNSTNMNTLMSIDWSTIDIVIIAYGTNDYGGHVPLGVNSDNMSDGSTFKGAMNYTIQQLQSAYPNLDIIFTTPIYRHRFISAGDGLSSDTHKNDIGLYLKDYAQAIEDIASLNHLETIDLYSISGVNKYTFRRYLSSDELHPSAPVGYSQLARKIYKSVF